VTWSGVCTMGNQGLVVSSMESSRNDSPGCWFVMSAACGCGAVKWRYGVAMCFGWKGRWGALAKQLSRPLFLCHLLVSIGAIFLLRARPKISSQNSRSDLG